MRLCQVNPFRLYGIIVFILLTQAALPANAQTALYVSKQTGETSSFSGSKSKTTDKYEHGDVTLSKVGPISYTVSPSSLSIAINSSQTWTGTVKGDPASAPAAGSSIDAKIIANYNVFFSRPQGTGSQGTVVSTYNCKGSSLHGGCDYHGADVGGMHEIVNRIDTQSVSFTVYSIKVTLPDTICLGPAGPGSSASGSATAESYPKMTTGFEWTSLNPKVTISDPTSQTPTITLSDTSVKDAKVKVKFTIQGVTYTTEAFVKYCDCQCKPLNTTQAFGPLSVTFSAPPASSSPDGEGYCKYSASDASFSLGMTGVFNKTAAITKANLSFRKNCKTGDIKDVTISWDGNVDIGDFKYFTGSVTHGDLTVDVSGKLSGSVVLSAKLTQDKDLTGKNLMILRKGITGKFKFNYAVANDFSGSFDFLGVTDINIDIVKPTDVTIAKFKNGALASDGTLTGTLEVVGGAKYKSNAFTVTMNTLSLGFSISLTDGFKLLNGSGGVTVSDMKVVTGTATLGLSFNQGNCSATLSASDMKAFSMTLQELNLTVNFDSDFNMNEFDGKLNAKHDKFDVAIAISAFNVKDGSLTKFTGSGQVKYSGFSFNLKTLDYDKAAGLLTISAEAKLDLTGASAAMAVDKFTIDQAGIITVGSISADLTKDPVKVHFDATFKTNEFKGNFKGDFASIGLDGSIVIGAEPTYNYGYFKLVASGNVPLGQSGLKLTKLGGEMGFNYKLPSTPMLSSYLIGLTIGVADVADLCQVTANPIIQITPGSVDIIVKGQVDVLKNNTFFSGKLDATYTLPANTIKGSVSTEIKVPGSGSIFKSNNLTVNFNIANNAWSADGSNMGGKMFGGVVDLSNGNISLKGDLSSPLALTGKLGGKATASLNQGMSQTILGTTFSGNIKINMNSNIDASLDQNGLSGSFSAHVDGSGTVKVENYFIDQSMTVSGSADGTVGYVGGTLKMTGTMNMPLPFQICIPFTSYCIDSLSLGMDISI